MKKRNKGSKNPNIKGVDNHIKLLRNRIRLSCKSRKIMTHKSVATLYCISVFFPD